jgi:hypothetical protein
MAFVLLFNFIMVAYAELIVGCKLMHYIANHPTIGSSDAYSVSQK